MKATQFLKQGDLGATLEHLQQEVRADPANAKQRTFLFQVCALLGDWERAAAQLAVAGQLDAAALPMVQTYRAALECEVLRRATFAGEKTPLSMGQPEEWFALLLDALRLDASGNPEEAKDVRAKALDLAPASAGQIDETPFEWIADADTRLGPVLEAIINGKYFWIPFHRLHKIQFEAPVDLRDLVWMPARITLANGGESVALIPTRYPGSEKNPDDLIKLSRKTEWLECSADTYAGQGQRMLVTDQAEYPIADVRLVTFTLADADPSASLGPSELPIHG